MNNIAIEKDAWKALRKLDTTYANSMDELGFKHSYGNTEFDIPKDASFEVVKRVMENCVNHYGPYGLHGVFLVGSRVWGNLKPNSDHDFVVVVGDDAPREVVNDIGNRSDTILSQIRSALSPDSIDIVVCRHSDFINRMYDENEEGSQFPYKAKKFGFRLSLPYK